MCIRRYLRLTSRPPPLPLPTRAGLSHLGEHREKEGVVPASVLDFAAYGSLVGMRAKNVECELAQNSEVFGAIVSAVAGAVFVEDDVEHPVQAVFDAPMGARDGQDPRRRPGLREQEVSDRK